MVVCESPRCQRPHPSGSAARCVIWAPTRSSGAPECERECASQSARECAKATRGGRASRGPLIFPPSRSHLPDSVYLCHAPLSHWVLSCSFFGVALFLFYGCCCVCGEQVCWKIANEVDVEEYAKAVIFLKEQYWWRKKMVFEMFLMFGILVLLEELCFLDFSSLEFF
jgi:hypothetical protein